MPKENIRILEPPLGARAGLLDQPFLVRLIVGCALMILFLGFAIGQAFSLFSAKNGQAHRTGSHLHQSGS